MLPQEVAVWVSILSTPRPFCTKDYTEMSGEHHCGWGHLFPFNTTLVQSDHFQKAVETR